MRLAFTEPLNEEAEDDDGEGGEPKEGPSVGGWLVGVLGGDWGGVCWGERLGVGVCLGVDVGWMCCVDWGLGGWIEGDEILFCGWIGEWGVEGLEGFCEGVGEVEDGGEAVGGVFGEGALEDGVEGVGEGEARAGLGEGGGRGVEVEVDEGDGVGVVKGGGAGEHLEGGDGEGVLVGLGGEGFAEGLFGGEVVGGAEDGLVGGDDAVGGGREEEGRGGG